MGKHSKLPPLKEDISPNVVPMIDIMFLLLLFFFFLFHFFDLRHLHYR